MRQVVQWNGFLTKVLQTCETELDTVLRVFETSCQKSPLQHCLTCLSDLFCKNRDLLFNAVRVERSLEQSTFTSMLQNQTALRVGIYTTGRDILILSFKFTRKSCWLKTNSYPLFGFVDFLILSVLDEIHKQGFVRT